MKKATLALLLIASAFICIMIGVLIGRYTADNQYPVSDNQINNISDENIDPQSLGKINVNTATLAQIDELPGIGPVLAQRIIDYRTENGPFSVIEDLMHVDGIGEVRFNEIKDYITTGG